MQILKVASFQPSLVQYGSEESDLLIDRESSRAFCFPSEEMMASMSEESHHRWGFQSSSNYSLSLQRVGQVLCRQLGFSIYERIVPKVIEEKREKILWASECLGYESSITHCLLEEIYDPEMNCTNFVGLKCSNCEDMFYTISTNETLEVTSPGFPNIYNDNSVCQWTIKKNVPSPFAVNIKYLSLPPRSLKGSCSKGSLDIMSRKDEVSDQSIRANLCGELENKLILVNNSVLDLRLYSGLFHPRPYGPAGFRVVVSVLQDLQAKGRNKITRSLSSLEIVGIIFGILIFLVPLSLCLRLIIRRFQRKWRQRTLASILHRKIAPRNTPLPAIPEKPIRKILKTADDQDRKLSTSSGIYEDILKRESITYLQLEDLNKEESRSSFNYDFKIPKFSFTPYGEDSRSCPSDIPSCSFTSDFDSVFGSEKNEETIFQSVKPLRTSTYTVTKKKSSGSTKALASNKLRSSTFTITKPLKEPSFSTEALASKKNKRFPDLQSSQRSFSESDAKTEKKASESFNSLQKTYTKRFCPTKT